MSGNMAAVLVVLMLAGLIIAARLGVFDGPKPPSRPVPAFELHLDQHGIGTVVVGGRDIANITHGVTIRTHAGEPSHVAVDLIGLTGDVVLDEAIVELREIYPPLLEL